MPGPDALYVRVVSYSCILKCCGSCGNPVPLQGPVESETCPQCSGLVPVPPTVWPGLLGLSEVRGQKPGVWQTRSFRERGGWMVDARIAVLDAPECPSCQGAIPVDREAWRAPAFDVTCPTCGVVVRFCPPPAGLTKVQLGPTHLATLVSTPLPRIEADAQGVVTLVCPSCGAALEPDDKGRRAVTCGHCGVSVVVPESPGGQGRQAARWTAVYALPQATLQAEDRRIRTLISIAGVIFLAPIVLGICGGLAGGLAGLLGGLGGLAAGLLSVMAGVIAAILGAFQG